MDNNTGASNGNGNGTSSTTLLETKYCYSCKTSKLVTEFGKHQGRHDGLNSLCKQCARTKSVEWSRNNPAKIYITRRRTRLKKDFGISPEEYEDLFRKQLGLCAICHKPSQHKLNIDHNHKTGNIRALLCTGCNRGLGFFQDSSELLLKAAEYIENHG